MNRLKRWWLDLNASLWFLPALMVAGAIVLAFALVLVDARIGHDWVEDYPLLFGAGADGARGMLAAIAGSMITVAALIFSLTVSTLAQVSSQYTPRVLRNFMGDRANQLVLGFFVSIFVYCLIVLRTIRGGDEGRFIPSLAALFGLVLALVSIGVLIFFIHHIASSIQASNIVRNATDETEAAIERLFPQEMGQAASPTEARTLHHEAPDLRWLPVRANRTGYVQSIDEDGLLNLARRQDSVVHLALGIGSFVAKGSVLLEVARYGPATPLPSETTRELRATFSIGSQRTIEQDAGFGLRQIVDIALKALSPGVNDTTTAVICIDHLGALLALLATRQFPDSLRSDTDTNRVRVVARQPSFADYVSTAFDQILTSGLQNVAVLLRLLSALKTIAERTSRPERLQVLRQQSELIAAAEQRLTSPHEWELVRQRLSELEPLLRPVPAGQSA
ncbi:DUF2254 domain-containing protein [Hymenobacter koreensis]|uniref:DUF2254 domain-containing protein n=1 Tax=Hymenobacter koreensis TaxID=1084523 RepID=A0ABP8IYZ9_9BACT